MHLGDTGKIAHRIPLLSKLSISYDGPQLSVPSPRLNPLQEPSTLREFRRALSLPLAHFSCTSSLICNMAPVVPNATQPLTVTICGGGNSTHVMAALLGSKPNVTVRQPSLCLLFRIVRVRVRVRVCACMRACVCVYMCALLCKKFTSGLGFRGRSTFSM